MESETDRAVVSHSFKLVSTDLETCSSTQTTDVSGTSLFDFSKGDLAEATNLATQTTYAEQMKALTALLECHLKATAPSQTPGYTACGVDITALIPPG